MKANERKPHRRWTIADCFQIMFVVCRAQFVACWSMSIRRKCSCEIIPCHIALRAIDNWSKIFKHSFGATVTADSILIVAHHPCIKWRFFFRLRIECWLHQHRRCRCNNNTGPPPHDHSIFLFFANGADSFDEIIALLSRKIKATTVAAVDDSYMRYIDN